MLFHTINTFALLSLLGSDVALWQFLLLLLVLVSSSKGIQHLSETLFCPLTRKTFFVPFSLVPQTKRLFLIKANVLLNYFIQNLYFSLSTHDLPFHQLFIKSLLLIKLHIIIFCS